MGQGAARQAERLWTRDFVVITFITLFTFIGFQMLLPTLPVYASQLGGSDTAVGLVVGVFTISAVIIRPFTGHYLDLYGRKGILFAGLLIFAASILAYAWAPSLFILLVFRFIHGIGWGLCSTASSTVATDVIPKSRLGEGMGYYGLASTLSMALAPALGLYIINSFNFDVLFMLSAGMVAVAITLALTINYHKPAATRSGFNLIEKAALRPTVVVFFITMTYGAVVAFIALYAAQHGITNIGSYFTIFALALAISRPVCGRLADRIGFDLIIIPGIILVATAMFLLYFASGLHWFWLAAVLYGAGFGAAQPVLQALAVISVPPQRRGLANATFFTGFDLGIGAGSIMWGAVASVTGYSVMYLLATIPAMAALASYSLLGRKAETSVAA
ncbi:MAG: Bacillibactin exporter [Firmicutes bacterium ADurb.Bin373]|nr:MAG: Bacillibactin exporter [Firmicutes bacterium ADurb.Bin373]